MAAPQEGIIAELQGCVEEEQAKRAVRRAVSVLRKVAGNRREREKIEKVSRKCVRVLLYDHRYSNSVLEPRSSAIAMWPLHLRCSLYVSSIWKTFS